MQINNQQILDLINKGYEGGYWDLKEAWHINKASLLHDIICFSNNLENCDAYIIIGISDNGSIFDIKKDKHRFNTQQINDFLKSKKFVGGMRPEVIVSSIIMKEKEIDIITIKNSKYTPYVLQEYYREGKINVSQGSVYTRIQDTNTPINSTADNDKVEQLFKKRFRIDETPTEKIKYYLEDIKHWKHSDQYRGRYYYEFAPEYSITLDVKNDTERQDFLCKIFPDASATWQKAELRVYDHVIEEIYHVGLDGYRLHVAVPDFEYIEIQKEKYLKYLHITKYSFTDLLNNFLLSGHSNVHREYQFTKWIEFIIFFKSATEKESFHLYLQNNISLIINGIKKIRTYRKISNEWSKLDNMDYSSCMAIKKIYDNWIL